MTPLTLKRLEQSHFAAIYYHDQWVGLVRIRVLPIDDQERIMNEETVVVDLVVKPLDDSP